MNWKPNQLATDNKADVGLETNAKVNFEPN